MIPFISSLMGSGVGNSAGSMLAGSNATQGVGSSMFNGMGAQAGGSTPGLSMGNMLGLMGSGGGQQGSDMGLSALQQYRPMDQYANIQGLMGMAQPNQAQLQQMMTPKPQIQPNQYVQSLMQSGRGG